MLKPTVGNLVPFKAAFAALAGIILLSIAATAGTAKGSVADALRQVIDAGASSAPYMDDQLAIRRFYANRDFQPFWYHESAPTPTARELIAEMAGAEKWGLRSAEFALSAAARDVSGGHKSAAQVASVEYELMSAVLRYARQASGGRITQPDRDLSDFLDRRPELPDSIAVIDNVTSAEHPGEVLRSFHPQHEQFQKLHALYVKTKSEAARMAAMRIAPRGPMLVPGARDEEIPKLRARLGLSATGDETLYDSDLKAAVKAFQRSNGLSADGLVGNTTRAALNKEAAFNLDAIVASMEEWRWMPRDLGARHLLINIPSYTVQVVEGGKVSMTERVIVGKPGTPTPVFSKPMTSIVLRPSWFLPDSIKVEKLLNAARRGRSLESEGIVVKKGKRTVNSWSVNWEKANLAVYQIYQPSGDGNALGNVKFLFPNKHSVYLHDTPNKSLFQADERLFSHGCVRLRNPVSFAQKILDLDKGKGAYDADRLADRGPGNNEITLDDPLPVPVGYFSVWIGDDGKAEFYGDPYGHDQRVTLALEGRWNEIDKGPRHQTVPDSGLLAGARLPSKRSVAVASGTPQNATMAGRPQKFIPPFGLFNAPDYVTPASTGPSNAAAKPVHSSRRTVGDMMTSAFGR